MKSANLVFILSFCLFFSSCKKDENYEYPTATLNDIGFDFSEGITNFDIVNDNDGEVVNYYPRGGNNPDFSNGLWWNSNSMYLINQQKDYGEIELSEIKEVDPIFDNTLSPLLVNHCYVTTCIDGFAKFLVLSVDTTNWLVEVEYEFCETGIFEH